MKTRNSLVSNSSSNMKTIKKRNKCGIYTRGCTQHMAIRSARAWGGLILGAGLTIIGAHPTKRTWIFWGVSIIVLTLINTVARYLIYLEKEIR